MTSAAGTGTGSGLSEGLRGHSSSLNSFTRPEKRVCPPSMRAVCTCRSFKVKVTASSQQPAKLAIFNSIRKKCLYGGAPGVAGPGRTY